MILRYQDLIREDELHQIENYESFKEQYLELIKDLPRSPIMENDNFIRLCFGNAKL